MASGGGGGGGGGGGRGGGGGGSKARVLSAEEECEFQAIFDLFDADMDGYITLSELRDALQELGQSFSEEEMDALFQKYDSNHSRKLEKDEFMAMVTSLYFLEVTDRDVYLDSFKRVDTDKDGTISLEELDRLFAALGRRLRQKDLELLFTSMGKKSTETVPYAELVNFILSTCGVSGGGSSGGAPR
jgi:Ca2+-binding EF-hand superfamily protein